MEIVCPTQRRMKFLFLKIELFSSGMVNIKQINVRRPQSFDFAQDKSVVRRQNRPFAALRVTQGLSF